MAKTTYNRVIRKLVVGFGDLFNNITLVRYNPNQTEQERFLVPIAYAAKELYVQRIEADPILDKKVKITLPRMSFEMTGFRYAADRKQNTNVKNFAKTTTGVISQYNPVPYDFDFSLHIYVRNIEDGTQIIEHILPYFTPDYTIKLNLIPEMGIIKEIPIVLKDTSYEVNYEGPKDTDTRLIIWTLNFNVKGFIFGQTSDTGLILTSITNILNNDTSLDTSLVEFTLSTGSGTYEVGDKVYQGYNLGTSTSSGEVVSYANNSLVLKNVVGNFTSTSPLIDSKTGANYYYNNYKITPVKFATVTAYGDAEASTTSIRTDATTITIDSNNYITTNITEY